MSKPHSRELRRKRKREGISYARHHRRPRSRGGEDTDQNISIVPVHLHQAWHALFANHSPEVICAIINERWLDPDYNLIIERKTSPCSLHAPTHDARIPSQAHARPGEATTTSAPSRAA